MVRIAGIPALLMHAPDECNAAFAFSNQYMAAVRTCMSKTYESSSLSNSAIGKTRAAKAAKGQRIYYEFRRCMVLMHVSLILTARAPAKVSCGVLNVDFVCAGPDMLSKSACCQAQTEVSPPKSAIGPQLDRDWTAIGRVPPVSPSPPSYVTSFLFA